MSLLYAAYMRLNQVPSRRVRSTSRHDIGKTIEVAVDF